MKNVEYRKFVSLKDGKMYWGVVSIPGKSSHVCRKVHKRASDAVLYGYKVLLRYEQMKKAEAMK